MNRHEKKMAEAGIKHRICKGKKSKEATASTVIVPILIFIISVSSYFVHSTVDLPPEKQETVTSESKAAIVDQLSLTVPSPTFNQTATRILKEARYVVDYYPSQEVTVGFYIDLLIQGYSLIILRVHSTSGVLFTSEPYVATSYVWEQLGDQVVGVCPFMDLSDPYFGRNNLEILKGSQIHSQSSYFGVNANFLRSIRNNIFQNHTIIMMGCSGLADTDLANALIGNGAEVCIGCNGTVSIGHTDRAIIRLLDNLMLKNLKVCDAITETMKAIGPDPQYGSILTYHPTDV